MQQLYNLRDWKQLNEGEVLELPKDKFRSVKLMVNAPHETILLYQVPAEAPQLLAVVKGLETITFRLQGAIDIIADGPIAYRTADNERAVAKPDGEKYTKMMERSPRNPEMEAVHAQMMRNMERRLAQQAKEFNRVMHERDAAYRQELERQRNEHEQSNSTENDAGSEQGQGSDEREPATSEPDTGEKAPARRSKRRAGSSGDDAEQG